MRVDRGKNIVVCPVCGEAEAQRQPEFEHFLAYPPPYHIVRCTACGMIYVSPRPAVDYSSDTFTVEAYLRRSLVKERLPDFERIYARLEEYLPHKGLLLEIGCAAGYFLDVGRKRGWQVQGIDAAPHLVAYAQSHFGLDAQVATSLRQANIAPESVDVIYAEHVFEHLREPMEMLMQIKEALREGGYLVVTVPNELHGIHYPLRRLLFRGWAATVSTGRKFQVGHINFFTLKTMLNMVQRAGLMPVSYSTWGVAARGPMITRSPLFKRWVKSMLFVIANWFDRGPNIEVFAVKEP